MQPPGAQTMNAVDCPDGLARCTGGVVETSRLAAISQPCKGTAEQCACPWERVGECDRGCVADDVVAVVDRDVALRQLCAPEPDAAPPARVLAAPPPSPCDEDDLYRCTKGVVIACADHAAAGACSKGCVTEGGALGTDAPVSREAAFAILCSR